MIGCAGGLLVLALFVQTIRAERYRLELLERGSAAAEYVTGLIAGARTVRRGE